MKPKQFFFVTLGIMAVLVGVGGTGYYYALTELHQRAAALSAQLAAQTAAADQIDTLTRLKHEYDRDIVPILPVMDAALPHDKKQTEILAQLQSIASNVGLSLGAVNMPSPLGLPTGVSQTVKAGTVLALPNSFQISGSFKQHQKFKHRVENPKPF
jgi:hypothetical protein